MTERSRRSTARLFAVAAVLANLLAMATNITIAVVGPTWWRLAMVPVGMVGIAVVWWSWRRYGRWLPG